MRPLAASGNRASAPKAGALQKPFTRIRNRSSYPGTGSIFGNWAPDMTDESPDIVGRLSVRPAIRSFLHAKKKKFSGHARTKNGRASGRERGCEYVENTGGAG